MNDLKCRDRMLTFKYYFFPNAVSPISYQVFGIDDLSDEWYNNITYKNDVKRENNENK